MKPVIEQFADFTQIFSADGYQFLQMRMFLESIEAKPEKTHLDEDMLWAFETVSKLCRYFLDQNNS